MSNEIFVSKKHSTMNNEIFISKKVFDQEDGTYRMLDDTGAVIAVKNVRTGDKNWWATGGVLIRDKRVIDAYNAAPLSE